MSQEDDDQRPGRSDVRCSGGWRQFIRSKFGRFHRLFDREQSALHTGSGELLASERLAGLLDGSLGAFARLRQSERLVLDRRKQLQQQPAAHEQSEPEQLRQRSEFGASFRNDERIQQHKQPEHAELEQPIRPLQFADRPRSAVRRASGAAPDRPPSDWRPDRCCRSLWHSERDESGSDPGERRPKLDDQLDRPADLRRRGPEEEQARLADRLDGNPNGSAAAGFHITRRISAGFSS